MEEEVGIVHFVVVQSLSHVWLFVTAWTAACQAPCPPLSPRVCSNSYPLSRWCHPTTSSSVAPFSFLPQSFPASESFPMSQLFASGGQSIGASASASVLPVNITLLSKDPSHLNANRPGQRPSPWQWQTLPAPLSFGRRLLQSPLSTRLSDQLQPDGISKNVACSHAWELNVWLAFSRRIRIHNVA